MVVKTRRKYGGGNKKTRKMKGGSGSQGDGSANPAQHLQVLEQHDAARRRTAHRAASVPAGNDAEDAGPAPRSIEEKQQSLSQFKMALELHKNALEGMERAKTVATAASSVVDVCSIVAVLKLVRNLGPAGLSTISGVMGSVPELLTNILEVTRVFASSQTTISVLANLIYETIANLPTGVLYITSGMVMTLLLSKTGPIKISVTQNMSGAMKRAIETDDVLRESIRGIYLQMLQDMENAVLGVARATMAAAAQSPEQNAYTLLELTLDLAAKIAPGNKKAKESLKHLIMLLGTNDQLTQTLNLSVENTRSNVAKLFEGANPIEMRQCRPYGVEEVLRQTSRLTDAAARAALSAWGVAAEAIVKMAKTSKAAVMTAKVQMRRAQKDAASATSSAEELWQIRQRLLKAHTGRNMIPRPSPGSLPPGTKKSLTSRGNLRMSGSNAATKKGGSRKTKKRSKKGGYRYKHKKSHKKRKRRPRTRRS